MLQPVIFYLFSAVLIVSALMVISARNPVHAVLFLILCFFNAAGLFVLLGAEFLAMILVIVYVGAVAVLFLFVVMMLDVNFEELRQGRRKHILLGLGVGAVILFQLISLLLVWQPHAIVAENLATASASTIEHTKAIGAVLYTHYLYPFQVSGLILLVAMIGAIVLTLRKRPDVKRQNVQQQLDRKREDVVRVVKVQSGKGAA